LIALDEIYAKVEELGGTIPDPDAFNYESVKRAYTRANKKLKMKSHNVHGVWYWSRPAACEGEFEYIEDKPADEMMVAGGGQ
jgi:hypothetical protein